MTGLLMSGLRFAEVEVNEEIPEHNLGDSQVCGCAEGSISALRTV